MLEKIHISFIPGTRGDFLSAFIFAAMYNHIPDSWDLQKTGSLKHNNRRFINLSHKSFMQGLSASDIIKLDLKSWENKLDSEPKDYVIGASHYISQMHISCWFKDMFIRSRPIIIKVGLEHLDSIATQFIQKNPVEYHLPKKDLVKQLETKITRLNNFEKENKDLLFVNYRDITKNPRKILEDISAYKKISLKENDSTKKLSANYITKNLKYDRYLL